MNSATGWQSNYSTNKSNLAGSNWVATSANSLISPLSSPDNWPQLGVEQEALQASDMHQQQSQGYTNNPQQPEPGGWGGGSTPSATTNGWGTASSSGWGAPDSSGNNWSRQPQVDNGTAVWGKPSQSTSGWGAPVPSSQNSAPNAWNTTPQTHSTPIPNPQNPTLQHDQQQSTQQQLGQPPPINPSSQPPESWAAAAAAPPTPGQPGHIPPVSQQSGGKISESDKNPGQNIAPQSPDETVTDAQDDVVGVDATDQVQQLVNSHEGWGKRPIKQNTSWDISESPSFTRQPSTKTGTEAWGKVQPAQSSAGNWQGGMSDSANQQWGKPATGNSSVRGWGPNPTHAPPQPRPPWGVNQPSQPQPGWGDPRLPPPMPNMNVTSRWGAPPNPMPSSSQGWGASGAQNNTTGSGSGWGNSGGAGDASNWGTNAQNSRAPQNSNWGAVRPEGSWNQPPAMQRQPSSVDDGTSAWGDPTAYKNVNMWDKKQGGIGDGQSVKPEATGWGGPPVSQGMQNKPPSPTGWGDTTNLSRQMGDNATSGWGKPTQNTTGTNWDHTTGWGNKPANASGWGGATEQSGQQWGQSDVNTGWNQSSLKNEATSKGMDFGFVDRKTSTGSDNVFEDGHLDGNNHNLGMESGNGRPGMNFNQFPGQVANSGMPGMNGPRRPPQPPMNASLQGQFQQAPPMPPQIQNQLQQIRQAVMKGVIPQQMLNPQLMTPHHVNLLQQLVMKTTEFQQLLTKHNSLNKPNVPLQYRSQREITSRMLQQCHQQIQACRNALTQNMLQKTSSLPGKTNTGALGGPAGLGMDMSSGMQPFNMSSISQSLPSGGPGSNNREQQSRLNTWRPSLSIDGSSDNPSEQVSHSTISDMIGAQSGILPPGVPGGGLFGLQQSDNPNLLNKPNSEVNGFESNATNDLVARSQEINKNSLSEAASATEPTQEQDVNLKNILAEIGPPEFIPGKKWEGFRPIDPENDPDITPGSVALQKTISVNTVKDADQVLNRDRYATSQVGSPASGTNDVKQDIQVQSLAASFANTLSDIPSAGIPSQTWSTATGGGNSTLGHTPTSLTHELWKVPLPKQSGNRQQPGWPSGPGSSWSTLPNNTSSRYSTSNGSEGSGGFDKTWVVLTNLNPQMDFTSLRNLCSMKGHMQSFQPNFPIRGMVLVKYSTAEEATAAKNGLNMSMAGSSMVVASIASDQEVSNFVTASGGGNWNTGQSGFPSRGSFGSSGTLLSNQQQHPPPNFGSNPMMHGSASTGDMQRMWSTGGNGASFVGQQQPPTWSTGVNTGAGRQLGGGLWGNVTGSGYEDPTRMMSPLSSILPENYLLPENLLGEQQM